ncbi:hypothetical protein BH012_20030 [Salmonella enterica]|nr:hypothetical protein [Salmonella enterica]EAX6603584.1 hypothetical protein [Salmonella enterica]
MIRGFDVMSTGVKDKNTGTCTQYYCVCLYCAMVSDDPWSTFNHYMLFPTYELAEAFLSYIKKSPKNINWDYWILQDAGSKAEPLKQTAKLESTLFNVSF